MRESYGEQDLTVYSHTVGKARVVAVHSAPTVFPSLQLQLEMSLSAPKQPLPVGGQSNLPTDFQLRDLTGELRLSEHGDGVGLVHWTGQRRNIRSGAAGAQLSLVSELDPWRVTRIEQWRDGKAPRFWLQLWPSIVGSTEWYDVDVRCFWVAVPHEAWLAVLERWGGTRFSILEVPYSAADAERFAKALEHVERARRRLLDGEYGEAVAACRLSIEALFPVLKEEGDGTETKFVDHLPPWLPGRRAEAYDALVRALKRVTNEPHHTAHPYRRAEAVFAVQTTQHALALLGDLTRDGERARE